MAVLSSYSRQMILIELTVLWEDHMEKLKRQIHLIDKSRDTVNTVVGKRFK